MENGKWKMAKIIPNIQFPIPNKNPNVQCQKFILELGIRHYWELEIGNWELDIQGYFKKKNEACCGAKRGK
jgi:hypothetical protein